MTQSSKTDENNESSKFIRVTWSQIVSAVVLLLFTGAIGFVGNSINRSMEAIASHNERIIVVEASLEKQITPSIESVQRAVSENEATLGTMEASIRRIEIMAERLDVIVNRLEEAVD